MEENVAYKREKVLEGHDIVQYTSTSIMEKEHEVARVWVARWVNQD